MILIISQTLEATTDKIIDWIDYYGASFKRLNGIDVYRNIKININSKEATVKVEGVDFTKVKTVWLRRWFGFEDKDLVYLNNNLGNTHPLKLQLTKFMREELRVLTQFFFRHLARFNPFDTLDFEELNKIEVLLKAKSLGLAVPDTYIVTNKKLIDELSTDSTITKAISNGPSIDWKNKNYFGYTALIKPISDKKLPETFLPSLFQNNIQKKVEIRTFFLRGKFYSMAIFSQKDGQTKVDFRVYNRKYPNRRVPYKLPEELERKLEKLAAHFKLSTCSFDILKTYSNEYILLEINSGGQFGMVSYPCNYFIEKDMAKALILAQDEQNNYGTT